MVRRSFDPVPRFKSDVVVKEESGRGTWVGGRSKDLAEREVSRRHEKKCGRDVTPPLIS